MAESQAAPARQRRPKPMPIYFTVREMIDPVTGSRVGALVPSEEADKSMMRERGFRRNCRVRAQLTQPRNERFNRLVHGMGKLLASNIDGYQGKQAHQAIKDLQLESEVYCHREQFDIPNLGRFRRTTPQSLSYDSMDELVFQDFWRQLCEYLVATYWPTLSEDQITKMAEIEAVRHTV